MKDSIMAQPIDSAQKQKFWDLIKDIQFAMLTTIDGDGTLRSRPMANQQSAFDGNLWFFTRADAHKVEEIARAPRVNLAYVDPDGQNYVSVSGTAEVTRDPGKVRELWSEAVRVWFPQGPDDPTLALLRVHVDKAEYWDSPSSAMVHLYGYARARLTGEPPSPPGENEELSF